MLKIIARYPSLFTVIDATHITKNQSIPQQGRKKVDFMFFRSLSLENPQRPAPYLANGRSIPARGGSEQELCRKGSGAYSLQHSVWFCVCRPLSASVK
jgi:hypothetical protein